MLVSIDMKCSRQRVLESMKWKLVAYVVIIFAKRFGLQMLKGSWDVHIKQLISRIDTQLQYLLHLIGDEWIMDLPFWKCTLRFRKPTIIPNYYIYFGASGNISTSTSFQIMASVLLPPYEFN